MDFCSGLVYNPISRHQTLGGGSTMKNYRYGLYMGAFAMPWIVLSHVFPSTRSDDELGGWIPAIYLCTFCYYGMAGFLAARKTLRVGDGVRTRVGDGARTGALTALIGIGLIIATFLILDNIFLETVSQQVDKIRGFQMHHYASMREYINWSHLEGVVFALPIMGLIGGVFGGLGGLLTSEEHLRSANAEGSNSVRQPGRQSNGVS
jgi:hypothetical protein